MINHEETTCLNCGKKFIRAKKKHKGGHGLPVGVRPCNTLTCSSKCSKEWTYKKENSIKMKEYQKNWREKHKKSY